MNFSDSRRGGHWTISFAAATFLTLILGAHAYLVYRYDAEISVWGDQFARTISGWYLWAAFFPFIFALARRFRFTSGTTLKSGMIHMLAGATAAIGHATIQILVNDWLLHPNRDWGEIQSMIETQFMSTLLWRFIVYQTIVCVSIALDSHQRARQIELQAAKLESSILQSQIESLKTQLDPEFLFLSLRELSGLMRRNFDQAESLVARLGAYLRMRLDRSGSSHTTLREEIDFLKCFVEIENLKRDGEVSIVYDLEPAALDCKVPGMILQTAMEDALSRRRREESVTLQIGAQRSDEELVLTIRDPIFADCRTPKLRYLIDRLSELNRSPIRMEANGDPEGAIVRIDIPIIPEQWNWKEELPQVVSMNRMEMDSASMQNPVRKWIVIIAVFTAVALFFTIQKIIIYANRGTSIDWPQHLLDYSGWYIWALLTPIVLKVSSRYPLQGRNRLATAGAHFFAFVATWVCATLAMDAVKWAANLGAHSFFSLLPRSFARSPITLDVFCYSTIVAVESAMRDRRRFETETMRTLKLSTQLARAKLDALKMQLHPHFLFNSLNSLSELMQEDPKAGEEMVGNLEMFLRLTIQQNHLQEISLEKELEFLKCYLAIENVRYQDRLHVIMHIEPQTLGVPVPNLLLQPIVENAIRHGIAPRSTAGQIEIEAKRKNGFLTLKVRDNGPGLPIRKTMPFRSGLGLANTRERLTQLYGEDHRFELVNAPQGGLVVSVEIPVGRVKKL